MKEAKSERNHKDSVFTKLFGEKENLLELYNAIGNTNYGSDTDIRITTLGSALYKGKINDISFIVENKMVVLIEHQSTINENMPLRMLIYSSKIYEKIINRKSLYLANRITIPKPEFIVMYNGLEDFSDHQKFRLSDMFAELGETEIAKLELEVDVYNINKGHNDELAGRSETLEGYCFFIYLVREYGKTMDRDSAVKCAVEDCISQNVLKKFLEENSSEVLNMLLDEWDWDVALEVAKEEGVEEGMEKERSYIKNLLEQGLSTEELLKRIDA